MMVSWNVSIPAQRWHLTPTKDTVVWTWCTAAAAPPPFRPNDPALCGSCPLVNPYYCKLGDLLYFVFIVWLLYVWFVCVLYVPSVLWYCWLGLLTCKNRLPYNLYCVGRDVKHCTIQSWTWCMFYIAYIWWWVDCVLEVLTYFCCFLVVYLSKVNSCYVVSKLVQVCVRCTGVCMLYRCVYVVQVCVRGLLYTSPSPRD